MLDNRWMKAWRGVGGGEVSCDMLLHSLSLLSSGQGREAPAIKGALGFNTGCFYSSEWECFGLERTI